MFPKCIPIAPLFTFMLVGCRHPTPFKVMSDLPYASEVPTRQTGDLYLPTGPGPHPVAVVIHGGGWSGRDRSDMEDISAHLATQGIAAYNISYRLAPEHRLPAQVEDVRAALHWIVNEAGTYTLEPKQIYTLGYSAGAHLALLAATDPEAPRIQPVIAGGTPTSKAR